MQNSINDINNNPKMPPFMYEIEHSNVPEIYKEDTFECDQPD